MKSRLAPLQKFVGTFRKLQKHVLPFISTRLTNAKAEGINRIVKIVKNRASGFKHLEAFANMIYLTIGDLNIPDQIPARFIRDNLTVLAMVLADQLESQGRCSAIFGEGPPNNRGRKSSGATFVNMVQLQRWHF